jgi:hypothetical protein
VIIGYYIVVVTWSSCLVWFNTLHQNEQSDMIVDLGPLDQLIAVIET